MSMESLYYSLQNETRPVVEETVQRGGKAGFGVNEEGGNQMHLRLRVRYSTNIDGIKVLQALLRTYSM